VEEENKYYTIILRHDTSTQWTINDPILALGEYGVEDDTHRIKRGDGVTPWSELLYETMGLDYLVTFANLKGSVDDNQDLKTALQGKVAISTFDDMNAKTVTALNITNENTNQIMTVSKTLKDVRTGGNTLQKTIFKSDDSSVQSFWGVDELGNTVVNLKATGSIGNFTPYFRYGLNQMCLYDNKLYKANKELVSEETFNADNWDLLFSRKASDIIFDPSQTSLASTDVQSALVELTKFSQDKVTLSKETNKIYGTDNLGLTKMYDLTDLSSVSTVNNVSPDRNKNITLTGEDININAGSNTTIKSELDTLNNNKLNIKQDASDAGKYLYINSQGNIQASNKNIVNTVTSDYNLVDNTDETNPKVLRDNTKLDSNIAQTLLTDFNIANTEEDITMQFNKVTIENKSKSNSFVHILKEGNININLVDDKLTISSKVIDNNITQISNNKLDKTFLGEDNKLVESILIDNSETGNGFKITQTSISPADNSQAIQILNITSNDNSLDINFESDDSINIDISVNANNIKYDNTTSQLEATNIKAAIDELKSIIELQKIIPFAKNTDYKQNQLVFVINENNITLLARVLDDYTSDNTGSTLLEAFENDVTNNKLSRIGIPNEVA
jgi:hypothetical protein